MMLFTAERVFLAIDSYFLAVIVFVGLRNKNTNLRF